MYSSIQSSSLVKSKCGCANNSKLYSSSNLNSMDVSFHPIMNDSGTPNYIALIDDNHYYHNDNIKIPSNIKINDSVDSVDSVNSVNSLDVFHLENDYIKTFYIGSITVVGLYILFRILDKSR